MIATLSRLPRLYLVAILILIVQASLVKSACQSCLHAPFFRRVSPHNHHHHAVPSVLAISLQRSPTNSLPTTFLEIVTLKGLQQSVVAPIAFAIGTTVAQRCITRALRAIEEQADSSKEQSEDEKEDTNQEEAKPVTSAMVATIGIYKNFISPLLPPACRFLPTCSQYGVQAIEQFGPTKGAILTAWRLMRCSPFGGKGYDPPKWPPVPYTYSGTFKS